MGIRKAFNDVTVECFLRRCPDWKQLKTCPRGTIRLQPRFVRQRPGLRQEFGADFVGQAFLYMSAFRRGDGPVLVTARSHEERGLWTASFDTPSAPYAQVYLPHLIRPYWQYQTFPLDRSDILGDEKPLGPVAAAEALLRKRSDDEWRQVCGARFAAALADSLDYALPRLDAAWQLS
jgi:hypothetical protein